MKFLSVPSIVLATTLATVCVPTHALAKHARPYRLKSALELLDPPDPWAKMDKGINLQYVYGDYNWRLMFGDSGYTTGTFPYPVARMEDMYDDADFDAIAEMGFHHVRFTVDPWALGMLEAPGSPGDPVFSVPGSNAAVDALIDDVEAANDADLLPIIDFHAVTLAQGAINNFYNATRAYPAESPALPWITYNQVPPTRGGGARNYNYLGTHKWHFLTNEENGVGQYPLEEFWASFAPKFNVCEFPIVYELLNEPYDTCWNDVKWKDGAVWQDGDDGEPDVTIYALDGALPSHTGTDTPRNTWIGENWPNWRAIQLRCIKAIEGENRLILVGNQTAGPTAFRDPTANIVAYTATDDEIEYPNNIGYVCHFYDPVPFTHKSSSSNTYENLRDFYDKKPFESTPYNVPNDAPMSNKFACVAQWIERTKVRWAEQEVVQDLHVVFTEFGCIRPDRDPRFPSGHETPGMGYRPPGGNIEPPGGDPVDGYPSSLIYPQSRWVFDTRREIEAFHAGWTYYGLFGSFAYMDGDIDSGWTSHGDWGDPFDDYEDALFYHE